MSPELIVMVGSLLVSVGSLITASIVATRSHNKQSIDYKIHQDRTMQSVDRLVQENATILAKLDANAERYISMVGDIASLRTSIFSIWKYLDKPDRSLIPDIESIL